ncbi:MAG: hypothetical protein FJ271_30165 [Planctomycetes bacterium]|nr:hypothetical protein [Planctomycetota bacterium]
MASLSLKWLAGLVTLLAAASSVGASGATFEMQARGIKLGKAKEAVEDGKDLLRIHAKAQVGKAFTLTAQGIILPRGGKAQPGEPDSGKWTIDEKAVKKLKVEKKDDKTTISIRVEPTSVGTTRLRFVGSILGYQKTIDVIVAVEK